MSNIHPNCYQLPYTSFIRTCFRALLGNKVPQRIRDLEAELYRTDDGTSRYSVYDLTSPPNGGGVKIHDTRGQREYSDEEKAQLGLILDGKARDGCVVEQRKRYWLMLREFWKVEIQNFGRKFVTGCHSIYV